MSDPQLHSSCAVETLPTSFLFIACNLPIELPAQNPQLKVYKEVDGLKNHLPRQ
jgi:hypothetical protein